MLSPETRRTPALAAAPVPIGVFMLIAGTIVVAALRLGRDLLVPLVLAVLLAFVLAPLVRLLRRLRVPWALASSPRSARPWPFAKRLRGRSGRPETLAPAACCGQAMDPAIIGYVATVCTITSFVPQAWRIIRTRDVASISKRMYVITVVGFSLWFTYGLMLGQWPLILTNGVCVVLSGFILLMKMLPRRSREAVAGALDPSAGRG